MTSGLRERKKIATRLALHESALRLVAERGLEHVSIEDIAARADVSPRTFFNYFPSKNDAVLGLEPDAVQRQVREFADRPAAESPVEALRAVTMRQAEEMAGETDLWPLRLTVIDAHPALIGRLAAVFGESERVLAVAIAERSGTRVTDVRCPSTRAWSPAVRPWSPRRSWPRCWRSRGSTSPSSSRSPERGRRGPVPPRGTGHPRTFVGELRPRARDASRAAAASPADRRPAAGRRRRRGGSTRRSGGRELLVIDRHATRGRSSGAAGAV